MAATSFDLARSRDAWFVIRGFKYQVDLTILRWLLLSAAEELVLECGEDIDIVQKSLSSETPDRDRELEQVKHLDKPITLRSPACRIALANAVRHFKTNPELRLVFRFCTNASTTTERPSVFDDFKFGIEIWEGLRRNEIAEPDRTKRLNALLSFFKDLKKSKSGVDDVTWSEFSTFAQSANIVEVASLIYRFEWSTQQPGMASLAGRVVQLIQAKQRVSLDEARDLYPRLFVHVFQLLAHRGKKMLDGDVLKQIISMPPRGDSESLRLSLLASEIISQTERVERLEVVTQQHETTITEIRKKLLEVEFGTVKSVRLASAISDISTALPPQVKPIATRHNLVSSIEQTILKHDWFAIYGSVGCGKTQLASLVGERLSPIVYVSLRDLNSEETNFLLQELFQRLFKDQRLSATSHVGVEVLENSTIILDDLPRLIAGDSLSNRLILFTESVRSRNQRIVTLSHHSVPSDIASKVPDGRFAEISAPELSRGDVIELFELHGAPSEKITPKIADSFIVSTSGNATLLAAIARTLRSNNWVSIEEQRALTESIASKGELVQDTMFRLLNTVANNESRELLYRLCVIIGAFGAEEVKTLAAIDPHICRPNEAYQSLVGLWIEKQSEEVSVVCPLISHFGAGELSPKVGQVVANGLAHLIFEKVTVTPIEFAKAVNYLKRAKNGVSLGMHVIKGLESVRGLQPTWQKLVLLTTLADGLLDDCPISLGLIVRTRQLEAANSLGLPIKKIAQDAKRLIDNAHEGDLWAVVGYASQAAPFIAKSDFDEGLRLGAIVLDNFESVIEFTKSVVGKKDDSYDAIAGQMVSSFPWFFVSSIKSPSDFLHWFEFITSQPPTRLESVLASDLARDGFKIAADRLWLQQHDLPEVKRDLKQVVHAYNQVIAVCKEKKLLLFHALVLRSKIIVLAEYLKDLDLAIKFAKEFLRQESNSKEALFLINDIIGRQYLYAKRREPGIERLRVAAESDTGTFDGVRCRTFLELSRSIGEEDCHESLKFAENAVEIARRNPREVPELDMVSALGEAATAAGFLQNYRLAFEYLDEAFSRMSNEFKERVDWKMRLVVLGNALGYFSSMALMGEPPDGTYTVPPRGELLRYNEALAGWYDERDYKRVDLAPTLLVRFATSVGRQDRAVFWARKGIDEARDKGVLACIYSLGEVLCVDSITKGELAEALDYAFEAATALKASMVAHQSAKVDIRDRQDVNQLLGQKPNDNWSQAEQFFIYTGIIPALAYCCASSDLKTELLNQIAEICSAKASEASSPAEFAATTEAVGAFLGKESSADLRDRGHRLYERGNTIGRTICFLLSSFADDTDLRYAILQHALVLCESSGWVANSTITWKFLTDQFVSFWNLALKKQRFRFSSPSIVEDDLRNLDLNATENKAKSLIQLILRSLSVSIPPQMKLIADWLRK